MIIKGLWLCSSNRDVCFILLEMMVVVRFVILMSILRDNKKLTKIYKYVKYKLRHFYRREFAFQKGTPGKAFQVYKTPALPTEPSIIELNI